MSHRGIYSLSRLRAGIRPFRLHFFPRLRSTNDHAASLRKGGSLFAPSIVLTAHQLAGRGRGNHTWWSGRGTLTATFVFPLSSLFEPHQLPLAAGLAVRDACARLCGGSQIDLKWPNDILSCGRKLAGLLCERVHKADLIGLGLNVNLNASGPGAPPPSLRNTITCLANLTGKPLDMTDVLISIARELHQTLHRRSDEPFSEVLRRYDTHHALVGRRISVLETPGVPPIIGRCEGLDDMGRLLLRDRTRLHTIISGQVQS